MAWHILFQIQSSFISWIFLSPQPAVTLAFLKYMSSGVSWPTFVPQEHTTALLGPYMHCCPNRMEQIFITQSLVSIPRFHAYFFLANLFCFLRIFFLEHSPSSTEEIKKREEKKSLEFSFSWLKLQVACCVACGPLWVHIGQFISETIFCYFGFQMGCSLLVSRSLEYT